MPLCAEAMHARQYRPLLIECAFRTRFDHGTVALPHADVVHRAGGEADTMTSLGVRTAVEQPVKPLVRDNERVHAPLRVEGAATGRKNGIARIALPLVHAERLRRVGPRS